MFVIELVFVTAPVRRVVVSLSYLIKALLSGTLEVLMTDTSTELTPILDVTTGQLKEVASG